MATQLRREPAEQARSAEIDVGTGAHFTIDEARRALPYVARVVRDAADAYRRVQLCRETLELPMPESERRLIAERRDAAMTRLNAAIDECNAVGVDLMDIGEGVVRFTAAATHDRSISLLWRVGEPIEDAWAHLAPGDEEPAHAATR